MTADYVYVKNLVFFANHGVRDEERKLGQKFRMSLRVETDFTRAAQKDRVDLTICYKSLIQTVLEFNAAKTFYTLEGLGDGLARKILTDYPQAQSVSLSLEKPGAAIDAVFDAVGVELYRHRDDLRPDGKTETDAVWF